MTAPVVDSVLDERILSDEPTCEVEFVMWNGVVECSNPAAWAGVCRSCGEHGLWCDECKDRGECKGDFRYWLNQCGVCNAYNSERWTKL